MHHPSHLIYSIHSLPSPLRFMKEEIAAASKAAKLGSLVTAAVAALTVSPSDFGADERGFIGKNSVVAPPSVPAARPLVDICAPEKWDCWLWWPKDARLGAAPLENGST